jgi:hypothetical protein
MCLYCNCRANDPVPGMRTGSWASDPKDHQGEISYSWTGYPIIGNAENINPVPPVGEQFRQQHLGGNGPQAAVEDK